MDSPEKEEILPFYGKMPEMARKSSKKVILSGPKYELTRLGL
jgi:hypothetical protein